MKEKPIIINMEPKGLTMETDKQQFALAFKTWRLRSGKTTTQIAEDWGISRTTIWRVEKGRDVTWEIAYRMFAKLSEELRKEAQK